MPRIGLFASHAHCYAPPTSTCASAIMPLMESRTTVCGLAESVIELKLDQIENLNLVAEPLSKVIPKALMSEGGDLGSDVRPDGVIRVVRSLRDIPLPGTSEEQRRRLRTHGITYTIGKNKYPSKVWLADATPGIWSDHADFVLGEQVAGLVAKPDNEEVVREALCRCCTGEQASCHAAQR